MKIITILGTRPEIIRLSQIIPKLDKHFDHTLVYTNQNSSYNLCGSFFDTFNLRNPDITMSCDNSSMATDIATIMLETETIINKVKPEKLLILGDTNSALSGFIAKRLGVKVYHMEAGNRCWSDETPEEVNRRVIDHSSDILLPYTECSRNNLLREGIHPNRIYVTGNPIAEVIEQLKGREEGVEGDILCTFHRAENVDNQATLTSLLVSLRALGDLGKVTVSTHPRTRDRLNKLGITTIQNVEFVEPMSFPKFINTMNNSKLVVTDSGTVQEEANILNVPNITIRNNTERPETVEAGSNIVTGTNPVDVIRSAKIALTCNTQPTPCYIKTNVSDTVIKIISSTL